MKTIGEGGNENNACDVFLDGLFQKYSKNFSIMKIGTTFKIPSIGNLPLLAKSDDGELLVFGEVRHANGETFITYATVPAEDLDFEKRLLALNAALQPTHDVDKNDDANEEGRTRLWRKNEKEALETIIVAVGGMLIAVAIALGLAATPNSPSGKKGEGKIEMKKVDEKK